MTSSLCVVGNDPVMVNDRLHRAIQETLGDRDPSLALEEYVIVESADEHQAILGQIRDALATPAFLVDRRVVVVREAQLLLADEVEVLLAWMKSPTPGTVLIMGVAGAKTAKLAKAADELLETSVGSGRADKRAFMADTFAKANVTVDASTMEKIAEVLGDELNRLDQLARTLSSIYGSAPLNFSHVAPYLGEKGDIPPWDLTDPIAQGDATKAIVAVRRMLDSRGKVALQVMFTLSKYFREVAILESGEATNEEEAAALTKSPKFTAKKQLALANRLGSARIAQALHWIAEADLALKGGVSYGSRDLDTDMEVTQLVVMEILVARLARLCQSANRR